MPRKVEYVIRILADEAAIEEDKKEAPEAAKTAAGESVSGKGGKKKREKGTFEKILKCAAFGYAKQIVSTVAQNEINLISLRTGNQQYQERVQFVKNVSSKLFDIGTNIALGAATGGLPGAIVGAAVGTVTTAINVAYEYRALDLSRQIENIGLEQARIRAGTGGSRIGRNY